jgi:hypothetical protein
MRASSLASLIIALGLASTAAAQQGPQGQRVTGKVSSVADGEVVIATATGPVHVALTPQTRILKRESARVEDIAPGAYLGTANQTNPDGSSGTSTEVHLMDNGPNVHAPMNNAGLVMTNGHVKSVSTTKAGREIDVDYGQGATQHIVVPENTPTTRMTSAGVGDLAPGEDITALTQPGADQKPTASFISISAPAH